MEKILQLTRKNSVEIAALVLSFALFGQVFFSSIVNVLSLDNRSVMLAFRLCLMLINACYILFFFFQNKVFSRKFVAVMLMFLVECMSISDNFGECSGGCSLIVCYGG